MSKISEPRLCRQAGLICMVMGFTGLTKSSKSSNPTNHGSDILHRVPTFFPKFFPIENIRGNARGEEYQHPELIGNESKNGYAGDSGGGEVEK